jgi:hypothetical protein
MRLSRPSKQKIRLPNKVTNETITKQNNTQGGNMATTEGGMFLRLLHSSTPNLTIKVGHG